MLSRAGASQRLEEAFDAHSIDIVGRKACSEEGDKIGKIEDYILDADGHLRYLVVDTGFWIFGKKILVPAGLADVRERQDAKPDDEDRQIVVLRGLSKDQVDRLPKYDENQPLDERYEREVMGAYFPGQSFERREGAGAGRIDYGRKEFKGAFEIPQHLQLLEERLQVQKHSEKAGEVHIRKVRETHTETVEVPVTEERLVIEHRPGGTSTGEMGRREGEGATKEGWGGTQWGASQGKEGTSASAGSFASGQDRIDITLYKEVVDVRKTPVVAEEVTIRKESQQHTEQVQRDVMRERLDVDSEGRGIPIDDRR